MITGRILPLQRLSTEDGPGIRTTVFCKGCPLRCAWCHNPESLASARQIQWHAQRCLRCHICLSVCANHCLATNGEGLAIDRGRCQGCGRCAEACPSAALEILGQDISVEELVRELVKDRAYYEKSAGGVTLSGGEPTFQADFAEALLQGLKQQGIATALDTCGFCPPSTLDRLLPHTDLVLFDLKLFDADQHQTLTGQGNTTILENLLRIRDYRLGRPGSIDLWIRTPLIPGATTAEDNLLALGQYIARELRGAVSRWELCAFNHLCRDQYRRMGLRWAYAETPLMTADELAHCGDVARRSGAPSEIVVTSGATRAPALA
jgi:pyruvate formate lyase activating enzyme